MRCVKCQARFSGRCESRRGGCAVFCLPQFSPSGLEPRWEHDGSQIGKNHFWRAHPLSGLRSRFRQHHSAPRRKYAWSTWSGFPSHDFCGRTPGEKSRATVPLPPFPACTPSTLPLRPAAVREEGRQAPWSKIRRDIRRRRCPLRQGSWRRFPATRELVPGATCRGR